jgi:hypothetical protein
LVAIRVRIGALVKVWNSPRTLVEGVTALWVDEIFAMVRTFNFAIVSWWGVGFFRGT